VPGQWYTPDLVFTHTRVEVSRPGEPIIPRVAVGTGARSGVVSAPQERPPAAL